MKPSFLITIILYLVVGLVSAGWLGKWGKREDKSGEEDYKLTCRHYQRFVFDTRLWGSIKPQQFLEWENFLQDCFTRGKIEETDYNKMLLKTLLELPQLAKCTQDNYRKFEIARSRVTPIQNAAPYVKWQLGLFEQKCLDFQYQRLHRPPEGSTAEGGPWPPTPAG